MINKLRTIANRKTTQIITLTSDQRQVNARHYVVFILFISFISFISIEFNKAMPYFRFEMLQFNLKSFKSSSLLSKSSNEAFKMGFCHELFDIEAINIMPLKKIDTDTNLNLLFSSDARAGKSLFVYCIFCAHFTQQICVTRSPSAILHGFLVAFPYRSSFHSFDFFFFLQTSWKVDFIICPQF